MGLACLAAILAPSVAAAEGAAAESAAAEGAAAESAADAVLARVDGQPIYRRDVERQVRAMAARLRQPDAARQGHEQLALEWLVQQRLVLRYLERQQLVPGADDLRLAVDRLEGELVARHLTLEAYLEQRDWDRDHLLDALRWQSGWQRLLDRYLTDENLERFFDSHRAQFDGTRLHVAHILWIVSDEESIDERLAEAERLRRAIMTGEASFADAARRHSDAPTGAEGGELGWIGWSGPMPEPFTKAAFGLQTGEVSEPVVTAFGVHLIQCLDIQPGTRGWQEVRDELIPAVQRYLFRWAADQERARAVVEFEEQP